MCCEAQKECKPNKTPKEHQRSRRTTQNHHKSNAKRNASGAKEEYKREAREKRNEKGTRKKGDRSARQKRARGTQNRRDAPQKSYNKHECREEREAKQSCADGDNGNKHRVVCSAYKHYICPRRIIWNFVFEGMYQIYILYTCI